MQAMRPPPETKIPLETPQLGYDLPTPETWRQRFRGFCYMETMGPQEVCSRLWEFALRWLEPQRRSKEQMLELVVLEQFLAILPREMQSWQWGHGVETCAEAVTLAKGFKLGQKEEKLQVIVSVKAEEVSSDNMHPAAASQEPGDSWPVQPKAECVDRPLEDSGERETPGPLDKPLQVSKEDPQSHQYSGGAWLLSRGEEKPPVEEPADLEPAQTSPGSLGEMDSLRPEKEPRHKSQGKPRKQKENVAVNKQRHIHPGRKTHRCNKCRKNFSCVQDLSQHQYVQSGEQPYLCTRCGKSFNAGQALVHAHTGEATSVLRVWEALQPVLHPGQTPAYPQEGEATSVLRVRGDFHSPLQPDSAQAYSHRGEATSVPGVWKEVHPVLQPGPAPVYTRKKGATSVIRGWEELYAILPPHPAPAHPHRREATSMLRMCEEMIFASASEPVPSASFSKSQCLHNRCPPQDNCFQVKPRDSPWPTPVLPSLLVPGF